MILDEAAQNRSLDNDYGATRGSNAPDTLEAAMFADHPDEGGIEITGGGYARVTFSNDDWLAAADGRKISLPVTFPDSTSAGWSDTATHIALRDPADGTWWDCVPLEEELDVTGTGDGPVVTIAIYYNNNPD